MANSSSTATNGTAFDTETVSSNGDHRQVIVIGDKTTEASVAPVDGTAGLATNVRAFTTGGCSPYHRVAAATTNAVSIKASAGQVYAIRVHNRTTYPIYAKFYDKASAPTVGSDTVVFVVTAQAGEDFPFTCPPGVTFSTGIAMSIIKGIADSDATAVALNDGIVDVFYK